MKEYKINGLKLKELRESKDLTQGQLAIKSGLRQSHISRMEQGLRPNATLTTLGKLADALHVPVGELVTEPIPQEEMISTRIFLRQKYGVDERTATQIEEIIETLLHLRKVREEHEAETEGGSPP